MATYLDAWLEEASDYAAGIARPLGDIARAKGTTQFAKAAGLSRESLYRALSADGNSSFATVLKVAVDTETFTNSPETAYSSRKRQTHELSG